MESKRTSVREETVAVSDTTKISLQIRHATPTSAFPSEPPTENDGRSTSEKKESQRSESFWEVSSTNVQR